MNKNQEAAMIALIFLFLWAFGMYTFQNLSISLPVVGDFSFSSTSQYFALTGLCLTFIVFLKARREAGGAETGAGERG